MSGLDLSKTKLEGAYINGTNFTGSNLNGVKLNKAWALKANFSNATLKGASLIETEMLDGICDGADFSGARSRCRHVTRQPSEGTLRRR